MDEDIKILSVQFDLKAVECPCGSGRLSKNCCGPVRPRTYSAELHPDNYHYSDGFAIGLDFSLMRIVHGRQEPLIGEVCLTQSYARKKNPKSIVKGGVKILYTMHPDAVLIGYDHIFAIDTNTKALSGRSISIAGVIHAKYKRDGDEGLLSFTELSIFEFWSTEIKAEILGWYALINAILDNPAFKDKKIAIVVDSELGLLEAYNNRSVQLFGGYYIPENIKLVYASADVGNNAANKLIKRADSLSKAKLDAVLKDPQRDSLKETTYPCMLFRQWE